MPSATASVLPPPPSVAPPVTPAVSIPDESTLHLPATVDIMLRGSEAAERETAWQEFLKANGGLLLSITFRTGRGYDDAMDRYAYLLDELRKDDFHRLRRYQPTGRARFTTWLAVVARRLCVDYGRHRYGRPRPSTGRAASRQARDVRRRLADLISETDDVSTLPDRAAVDPESLLHAAERSRALARALGQLGFADRRLLDLRFDRELSARDIARELDLATPFHVYRRLRSVLATLRRELAGAGMAGADD